MQQIPLSDAASQKMSITLGSQSCEIRLFTASDQGLFCDLYVDGTLIIGGVICQNLNRIVRDGYLGFTGDLVFQDTQGSADPSYPGLGTRYLFWYLEAADVASISS